MRASILFEKKLIARKELENVSVPIFLYPFGRRHPQKLADLYSLTTVYRRSSTYGRKIRVQTVADAHDCQKQETKKLMEIRVARNLLYGADEFFSCRSRQENVSCFAIWSSQKNEVSTNTGGSTKISCPIV